MEIKAILVASAAYGKWSKTGYPSLNPIQRYWMRELLPKIFRISERVKFATSPEPEVMRTTVYIDKNVIRLRFREESDKLAWLMSGTPIETVGVEFDRLLWYCALSGLPLLTVAHPNVIKQIVDFYRMDQLQQVGPGYIFQLDPHHPDPKLRAAWINRNLGPATS